MQNTVERLKEKGIVPTPQRLAVAEFLEDNTAHPTADEIYRKLRKKYPTISQATVYTSLEVLKQAGEIIELTIRREKVCFDPNTQPHHHFFCRKCNRVLDIEISCPTAEKEQVDGHRIEEVQGYFYGVCSYCIKKKSG